MHTNTTFVSIRAYLFSISLLFCLGGFTTQAFAWSADDISSKILAGVMHQEGEKPPAANLQAKYAEEGSLFQESSRRLMREFFAEAAPQARNTRGLIYLFGGPDVLYPEVIFPNYERLLLVGLETPGFLPDATQLSPQARAAKISDIANAYMTSLRVSYFITSRMAKDLQVFGTTTMIAAGLSVQGFEILQIEPISISENGDIQARENGRVPGVNIQFRRPNGRVAEVTYLQFDLSDENMARKPEFSRFVKKQNFDTAFYKAASFVSHNSNFSAVNNLVLNQVRLLLQADDGIPVSVINKFAETNDQPWSISLYGVYTRPDKIFGVNEQKSARNLFGQGLCNSRSSEREVALVVWQKVWGSDACREPAMVPSNAKWMGFIPFRFGYAAVSGPAVVERRNMNQLGTLMVFER